MIRRDSLVFMYDREHHILTQLTIVRARKLVPLQAIGQGQGHAFTIGRYIENFQTFENLSSPFIDQGGEVEGCFNLSCPN